MNDAIDTNADKTFFLYVLKYFLILSFSSFDHGSKYDEFHPVLDKRIRIPRAESRAQDLFNDFLCALTGDTASALITMGRADLGKKKPEIIVDLRRGSDG